MCGAATSPIFGPKGNGITWLSCWIFARVGYRAVEPGRIALYSAHAGHLADELLQAMPVGKLPPSLKGTRLKVDMGM